MVIVSGLPGSGKSYFASRLAKELNARYINSDLTRTRMDARGKYAFDDKLDVYEEMAREAGTCMREGESVVVDATFYRRSMRELFFTLAKLLHHKLAYIEIVADEDLIRERLKTPRLDSEADFSVYRLLKPQYETPEREHLVVESKDGNVDSMLRQAKEYIGRIDDAG